MKDYDEAIERVMGGLREVAAPVGMERRIVAGVEARAAARGGWGRWVMVGACVVVIGIGVLERAFMTGPEVRRPEVAVVDGGGGVGADAAVDEGKQRRTTGGQTVSARSRTSVAKRFVAATGSAQEEVVAEMYAPRLVAPPMPLTEQEKLLLQVVRRGDGGQSVPQEVQDSAVMKEPVATDVVGGFFSAFHTTPDGIDHATETDESEKGDTR